MSNMYERLKEQARESQKRWNKIEEIINHMKRRDKDGEDLIESDVIECLELIMLNLRPATNIESELAGLEADLFNLEKVMGKGK